MESSLRPPIPYLYQRARAPRELELADIAWLRGLEPHERDRALADLKVVQVNAGELLCRVGRPVTYWFGVIEGLVDGAATGEVALYTVNTAAVAAFDPAPFCRQVISSTGCSTIFNRRRLAMPSATSPDDDRPEKSSGYRYSLMTAPL